MNRIMTIYARPALAHGGVAPGHPAIALEGAWPAEPGSPFLLALDDVIDGRFEALDEAASAMAESLARDTALTLPESKWPPLAQDAPAVPSISPFYLNALDLRYFLLKLLRVAHFFSEICPPRRRETLQLIVSRQDDRAYVDVLQAIAHAFERPLVVRWSKEDYAPINAPPSNPLLRRALGELAQRLEPDPVCNASSARAVFCGNTRVLAAICESLVDNNWRAWWLYDRFAVRTWLAWRRHGVGQLFCNSSLGRENRLSAILPQTIDYRGVDLAPAIGRWFWQRSAQHGASQTRLIEQLESHFSAVKPSMLVLDEDATPMARAAVAVARRHGAKSLVIQHGVPCCRFGFAPPAADRIGVWDAVSRRQLMRWGVSNNRIVITGSPHQEQLQAAVVQHRKGSSATATRFLLLNTVPPRDHRPDAIAMGLNSRTYAIMLDWVLGCFAARRHLRLTIKKHPRAGKDAALEQGLAKHADLAARVLKREPLAACLADADCVISCGSSAGVEASAVGLPVIQLVPPAAADFLSREDWGAVGIARSAEELGAWIDAVVHGNVIAPRNGRARDEMGAAERIVRLIEEMHVGDKSGHVSELEAIPA